MSEKTTAELRAAQKANMDAEIERQRAASARRQAERKRKRNKVQELVDAIKQTEEYRQYVLAQAHADNLKQDIKRTPEYAAFCAYMEKHPDAFTGEEI